MWKRGLMFLPWCFAAADIEAGVRRHRPLYALFVSILPSAPRAQRVHRCTEALNARSVQLRERRPRRRVVILEPGRAALPSEQQVGHRQFLKLRECGAEPPERAQADAAVPIERALARLHGELPDEAGLPAAARGDALGYGGDEVGGGDAEGEGERLEVRTGREDLEKALRTDLQERGTVGGGGGGEERAGGREKVHSWNR